MGHIAKAKTEWEARASSPSATIDYPLSAVVILKFLFFCSLVVLNYPWPEVGVNCQALLRPSRRTNDDHDDANSNRYPAVWSSCSLSRSQWFIPKIQYSLAGSFR